MLYNVLILIPGVVFSLSGLSPFLGDTDGETFTNVTHGRYDFEDEEFDNISDEAKEFIDKLLVRNMRFVSHI